jgi:hypothetical protein
VTRCTWCGSHLVCPACVGPQDALRALVAAFDLPRGRRRRRAVALAIANARSALMVCDVAAGFARAARERAGGDHG